jgi:serine/threonine protein kinase/tetratricopeptide (TPR) repeat protein
MDDLDDPKGTREVPWDKVPEEQAEPPENTLTPASRLELQRGYTVGRFLILHPAGKGGMGTVYAAYDPELDRKVALKFIHAPKYDPHTLETAQARLLREAQAMARVSHPNVITLYDVGLHEGDVYMAMEYVEGTTLAKWLKEGPRSWSELLPIFRAAGQGLAAAHATQLVHRDFKPSNVLLGQDGRVQVMDFGLARLATPEGEAMTWESPVPLLEDAPGATPRLHEPVTLSGHVMGTPQYMAPEQLRGDAPDARSDQFSFCASLYYALYGQRPFEPKKMMEAFRRVRPRDGEELSTVPLGKKGSQARAREELEKLRGLIQEPPREPRVPGWLKRAMMRGLALSPEDRFASMEELLARLSGPPPAVRRLWAGAIASVILIGYPVAYHALVAPLNPCAGIDRKLAGIWDADTQEQVQAAFTASGRPYAASTWASVKEALDGYTGRWVRMETQICEAAQVRSQPVEGGLAARQDCLEQRRVQLEATTRMLAQADGRIMDQALDAVSALPALERCADVEALTRTVRQPETPEARARVRSLQGELARIHALGDAGKHHEALALSAPLLAEARALGHPPLLATVLYEVATHKAKTGDMKAGTSLLLEAYWAAEAGRDDALRAELASQLAYAVGYMEANSREGRQWGQHAQAVLDRLGGDDALQAELLMRLSAVAAREGQFTEAKELGERALALHDQARGPDHPKRPYLLTNLGNAYTDLGDPQRGQELMQEALAVHDRLLGTGHPGSLPIRMNLASALIMREDLLGAQYHLEQVLATAPTTYGQEHVMVGHAHRLLGINLDAQGRFPEALQAYEKALAILEKAVGPSHPDVAMVLGGLGKLHLKQQQPKIALPYLERALTIDNPDGSQSAAVRFSLAQALVELERSPTRARALAQQASQAFLAAGMKEQAAEVAKLQESLASKGKPSKRRSRRN